MRQQDVFFIAEEFKMMKEVIETKISRNDKFLKFNDTIVYDNLAHKLNQSQILVMYLNVDFKPRVVEEYLQELEQLFRAAKRDPSRVCWSACCDRSFDEEPYIIKEKSELSKKGGRKNA